MINKIDKNSEFDHFQHLSNEWWLENGKFKILHSLTPLRIKYIKNNAGLSLKNLIKKKNIFKGLDILDLGCGGGLICEPLAKLGGNITGVDFIKKNIEVAKKHAKVSQLNITYINQDLFSINFKKKFDIILMLEVIEHINNWQDIIIKIQKYLKPKGKIIFSTINRTPLSKIFAISLAENILKWIPKNTHHYEKFVKPEELTTFLRKKKMKVINITGLFFNPILREWTFSKKIIHINYFCTAEKIS